MKIGFVSLGCSKNLVDTELIIGSYRKKGYEIVSEPSEAEVILINTCGFIESAKREAINTILEMAEYKKTGKCKYLIATGCLVQRYKKELQDELPEVDLWVDFNSYDEVFEDLEYVNRMITTGNQYAYLKIAEGCSNNCTYCAIPKIRGPYKSRKYEEIIAEAELLSNHGFKEIILIAQDTSRYGVDLYGKQRLPELLNDISKFNFKWVRFLYTYPEMITDELVQEVKNNGKVCHYFDIPIQHISDRILKRMGRKSSGDSIKNIIRKIRKEIPDVVIRTSIIVGFPGETEEQFEELKSFIKEFKLDRVGVFKYSKEDGTPAELLGDHITEAEKQRRYDELMEIQQKISFEKNKQLIETEVECMIEGKTNTKNHYEARSYRDIPDTDGRVYIKTNKKYSPGDFAKLQVEKALEYDLIAVEK